jgi:prepilin-type N-terminal cleavage/methylation domain-containing protein
VVQLSTLGVIATFFMARKQQQVSGVTLTELLCVIAIISILLAFSMGPIIKAFIHVKKFLGD